MPLFATLEPNVDHPGGVDNAALCDEQVWMAQHYRETAVAQQNALDVACHVFADVHFDGLRRFIFHSAEELACFRGVIVNAVMATADIVESNTKAQQDRAARWMEATENPNTPTAAHLQQIVTLEYLLQFGQTTYVMQDGRTYMRESQLRFDECVVAYQQGHIHQQISRIFLVRPRIGLSRYDGPAVGAHPPTSRPLGAGGCLLSQCPTDAL